MQWLKEWQTLVAAIITVVGSIIAAMLTRSAKPAPLSDNVSSTPPGSNARATAAGKGGRQDKRVEKSALAFGFLMVTPAFAACWMALVAWTGLATWIGLGTLDFGSVKGEVIVMLLLSLFFLKGSKANWSVVFKCYVWALLISLVFVTLAFVLKKTTT